MAAIAMDARWRVTTTSAALSSPTAKTRRDVHAATAPSAARSGQAARLLLAFLSGALVMGLEILWSRMFSMVHENSVYSFAASGLPSEPRWPDGSSRTALRRGEQRPGPGQLPV